MHPYLEQIMKTGKMIAPDGSEQTIQDHISLEQGLFLQEILLEVKQVSLEIGFSFGVSSMFIILPKIKTEE